MRRIAESAVSMVLAAAGIAVAASVVKRTFFPSRLNRDLVSRPTLEYVSAWREALPIGLRVGDESAPVAIVELADLECPACRAFHQTIQQLLASKPRMVAVIYVHFPLAQHRFSLPAARAAECAARVGRLTEWIDLVFAKQDSLGLKSWGAYAREAGIADTVALARCAVDPAPVPHIDAGIRFGQEIAVSGTPTVMVNGWRFAQPPTLEQLNRVVLAVAANRDPRR